MDMNDCAVCEGVFGALIAGIHQNLAPIDLKNHFISVCHVANVCEASEDLIFDVAGQIRSHPNSNPLEVCRLIVSDCPQTESWKMGDFTSSGLDLRVSKGFGKRGYDAVRISVITEDPTADFGDFFDYSSQFKYRWTQNYLHSAIKSVHSGDNIFVIQDTKVSIHLPSEDEGITGIILGDPCIASNWIPCDYGDKFNTIETIPGLINAFSSDISTDFISLLGDNFYDQDGSLSSQFFSLLTQETKSKYINNVIGNHDFWVYGSPAQAITDQDQFGNGFMQYYGQDTAASMNGIDVTIPYDFSVNPDDASLETVDERISDVSNHFYYYQLGNTVFLGYSGAHGIIDTDPYLSEFCEWVGGQNASTVLLSGHWNDANNGCEEGNEVPSIYKKLLTLDGCSQLGSNLKYVMGHTHCNRVTRENTGFLVAGLGKEGCGNFGITVYDSTGGRRRMLYYPVYQLLTDMDNYQAVVDCFREKGVAACEDLAIVWMDEPI